MIEIMKKAIIYFEGKKVCDIEFKNTKQLISFEGVVLWTKFFIDNDEIGFFNNQYSYIIEK